MGVQNPQYINLSLYQNSVTGNFEGEVGPNGARLLGKAKWTTSAVTPSATGMGGTWGGSSISGGVMVVEEGALKMTYPVLTETGAIYNFMHFDLLIPTKEIFVRFRAKMPNEKNGCKFLKVFGKTPGAANCTFGLDYTGIAAGRGSQYNVIYGDGTTTSNDAQCAIGYGIGSTPSTGRAPAPQVIQGGSFVAADWGTGWHDFRYHVKFNDGTSSGDEIPNGEFTVIIDGVQRLRATGLFNRHPTNGDIGFISLGDQSQGVGGPFDIYYDDVFVSTGTWWEGN